MNVQLSTVLTVLSILGIIGGFIWWLLGRILTDRKDKLTLTFEVERLQEKIKDIKEDIEDIKERIKHL